MSGQSWYRCIVGADPQAFGDCVVQSERHPLDGWALRILRADPRVLVDAAVLGQILNNHPDHPVQAIPQQDAVYLRIRGVNRTVVYRIGEYLPERRAYVAQWPD